MCWWTSAPAEQAGPWRGRAISAPNTCASTGRTGHEADGVGATGPAGAADQGDEARAREPSPGERRPFVSLTGGLVEDRARVVPRPGGPPEGRPRRGPPSSRHAFGGPARRAALRQALAQD